MQQIVQAVSGRLSDGLRREFGVLFTRAYLARDQAPSITVDDIGNAMPYEDHKIFRTSVHIGQRKLALSEIQFLTQNAKQETPTICVYAGAAPGVKMAYVGELFPQIKFLLVDPNPFMINGGEPVFLRTRKDDVMDLDESRIAVRDFLAGDKQLYIINTIFTNGLAQALGELVHAPLFISDIRTNLTNPIPDTLDLIYNYSMQFNWITHMKPLMSMMKWRHPFYESGDDDVISEFNEKGDDFIKAEFEISRKFGIDFMDNFAKRELVFPCGIAYLQCWQGHSSTETRIWIARDDLDNFKNYGSPDSYDNKLFYYNCIERCYMMRANPNANRRLGFDHCNDCAIENDIWEKYTKIYGGDVLACVERMSKITYRSLVRDNHGRFFGRYSLAEIRNMKAREAKMAAAHRK